MEENIKTQQKVKKPIKYTIFLILGILSFVCCVTLIVLSVTVLTWEHMPNLAMLCPGVMLLGPAITFIVLASMPAMQISALKSQRYVMQQSQQDLTAIADMTADITDDAVTQTAKAVKNGLKETKYCKHCGKEIDKDSLFCKDCGKQQ